MSFRTELPNFLTTSPPNYPRTLNLLASLLLYPACMKELPIHITYATALNQPIAMSVLNLFIRPGSQPRRAGLIVSRVYQSFA
jgi:hypothetical protein